MQSLTMDESQQASLNSSSVSSDDEYEYVDVEEAEEEESGKPRKLVFDPEPTQRMVVVRRRRRRRSKKVSKAEKIIARVRIALLVIIFAAIGLKLAGHSYITSFIQYWRGTLHPLKERMHFQGPDIEVIVLAVVAIGLIYTIPAVQSRVNRMLGFNTKHS